MQLVRRFGTFPIPEFKELDADAQEAFWLAAGNGKENLDAILVDYVMRSYMQRRIESVRSLYYPLSVWAEKGYDPQCFIDNKAECYRDPALGMVYRLWFTEEHCETIDEMAWKRLRERKRKRAR